MKSIKILLLFISTSLSATNYYVATTGNDLNTGTIDQPWATWQKAFTSATAGDTVYFRGGIYYTLTLVECNQSGTENNPIFYTNYPGETPILDGSNKTSWSYGLYVHNKEYINIKGLTIRNNYQLADGDEPSGIVLEDCNNILLESCLSHDNGKRGFYIYDSNAISILNCDAYNNSDNLQTVSPGAGGDGFLIDDDGSDDDTFSYVAIQGCRAWHNSDDGFEFASRGKIQTQVCWSWNNGYLDGGDGIGFNYGLKDSQIEVYNNTSYRNGGYGFSIFNTSVSDAQELNRIYRNNVAYYNADTLNIEPDALYTHDHNSWDLPVTITDADFISVNSVGITGPRQIDGSLPDLNFLKLSPSSNLIDAGIDIGLPYSGLAPDLGAYEGGVSQVIHSFSTSESIIINCIATDNTSDGFIANSTENLLINLDRQADSLALVDLYNSTNGPGWTNNDNWLTGPMDSWHGISLSGDRVTRIDLEENNLTGTIPPTIGNLTNLERLVCYSNGLSGSIPQEVESLSSLITISLWDNQLTGPIPSELWNLENLRQLILERNNLSGNIPADIENLTLLTSLRLANNSITGTIPIEIGNLTNLTYLAIYNNQFSGPIPDELTNLTQLTYLALSQNQFTYLPDLSSTLLSLDQLYIHENHLTFKDIEPNLGVASTQFMYSPQANIPTEKDSTLYLGSEMYLMVSAGGLNSRFQWYKDGSPLGVLSTDSILVISPVNLTDAGIYTCEVTNTVATDLTLSANPATLEVINAILVSNTDDAGPGSLRNAIEYANTNPGRDSIIFNIPEPGLHTIQPVTPLPPITDPLVIDGYTQPGAEVAGETTPATLLIQLDGINLIEDVMHSGLQIGGGNSTVRGLIINQFADGIHIHQNGGNIIEGNYIGVDNTGLSATLGNTQGAVRIWDCSDNIIGGDLPWQRNIIASESGHNVQILLTGAFDNVIKGNYLGIGADGETEIGNTGVGVRINGGAHNNTIGPNNIISGHNIAGIDIAGYNTHDNRIIGNLIGTDQTGEVAIGNGIGIQIDSANNNVIGGLPGDERNIISGNQTGIQIGGLNASNNTVIGNYIGTDIYGTSALGNGWGIYVYSNGNTIGGSEQGAGNVISGNINQGLDIISTPGSDVIARDNKVLGNIIGLDATGTTILGNNAGVLVVNAPSNIIGGKTVAERNIISGNASMGLYIGWMGATGNTVQGNYIGTNLDGAVAMGNGQEGILINGPGNFIGGREPGTKNLISGNNIGISLKDSADYNLILGNYIGTDVTGIDSIPNTLQGIYINSGASYNRVGGATSTERNIISGNGNDTQSHGIVISDNTTSGNIITGNYIGLDARGEKALGNRGDGIQIINDASKNIIGGVMAGERNVISGNGVTGIAVYDNANENKILGNYIGLDASGLRNIGHPGGSGIYFGTGASGNVVGGTEYGAGNYIAGNTGWAGIALEGSGTEYNRFNGNLLGVNSKREGGFGNLSGIRIYNGASNNLIGGVEKGEGNLVSFSKEEGILVYNDEGNQDPTTGNLILSNIIHSNVGLGIDLGYDGVTPNDVGDIDSSPNNFQNYPVLDSLSFSPGYVTVGGYLNSTSSTEFIIQLFASKVGDNTDYGEGQTHLGSETVTTDVDGNVSFVKSFPILGTSGQVITATATDPGGNSSEFSLAIGGVKDHILADINRPFYYTVNEDGLPTLSDNSDIEALGNAFQAWTDIPSAEIEFISAGKTTVQNASATDKVNLVTFRDEKFPFAPGILAISAKTLRIDPSSQEAEIIDADIVFNPYYVNRNEYSFGVAESENDTLMFDIQSITVHEIGHILGLIHSGAPLSTMFFMISTGTELRSLEKDDIAWASYRYQGLGYNSQYGSISGKVRYGDAGDPNYPDSHPPVAGALILAVDTVTKEQIHTYSDADGLYTVPVPADNDGAGHYWIYIQPLDGDVFGYPLRPGNISSYIYSNTIFTDFPNEWYNGVNESAFDIIDTVTKATVVDILAGESVDGIDLITNRDDKQPYVVSVFPSAVSYNDTVDILSDIIIRFSEPVDRNSFTGESCFLEWEGGSMGGDYFLLGDSTHIIIFSPEEPMLYDTEYRLHLTGAITDLKNNPLYLVDETVTTFKTELADILSPVIDDIIPENGTDSVFVTSEILVFFSEPMDQKTAINGFTLSCFGYPQIEGSITWNPENTLLTYRPLRPLKEGTEYTILLSKELTDLSGNPLEKDSIVIFYTIATANPEIIYLGPENNSFNVSVETPVVVDFSEPIDKNTVNTETFRLLRDDSSPVAGSFDFLMENSRVVFRPEENLDFNGRYSIELTGGIYDVSLPALPLIKTSNPVFTTATEPLMPYILYLDPPAGVIGSVVIIAGSGFDPDPSMNTVLFNGTRAEVRESSLTTIAVGIPVGAVSGDVTVTVNGSISNAMQFNVLSQSLDPCEEVTANINTGSKSRDVAINPEAGLAYVTNSGSGTVSVIALNIDDEEKIIKTVRVGEEPMKIDIDPLGKFAYVTNYRSHTVSVINLVDYTVRTIKVGENPYGVVVSPDGKVYVSNETSQDVSVIDVNPESGGFNHVIANINTGTRNRDIDISPEAGYVLVAGDDGLTIINVNQGDINYNTVIANVNTGTRTRDVEVTPEAALAIVSTDEGDLFIVDIYPYSDSFGSVIANINTGTRSRDVVVSPDAMFVYVTSEEGSVSVYKIDIGGVGSINTSYSRQIGLSLHTVIPAEVINARELEGIVIDYNADYLYVVNPDFSNGFGQLIQISLCCGPILPENAIRNLIINIQNMLNSGLINKGNANALITKLNNALKMIDKGQTKTAINILNAFSNQVEVLSKSGDIPQQRADAIIYANDAIIFNLENPPLKSFDMNLFGDESNALCEATIEKIFPNPFSETISVYFKIQNNNNQDMNVNIRVYNSAGQLIKILTSMTMPVGDYIIKWDGRLENGQEAPDNVYFIYFRAGDSQATRKIILQRNY